MTSKATERACSLDAAVHLAAGSLRDAGIDQVDALFSMATGSGMLPTALERIQNVALEDVPGVPDPWRESTLIVGELRGCDVWLIEDPSGDPPPGEGPTSETEPWTIGFPAWLAAHMGAYFNIQAAAGVALDGERRDSLIGKLALVSDHINLSGRTPLVGIGGSHLGPLFPDLTDLHHPGLRRWAMSHGESLGLPVTEAICACTLGPSLLTPAERRYLAKTGADIAVQGLASPLLAAAHAGLSVLAVVAITDDGEEALDIRELVAQTEQLAPALDDLLLALSDELATMADELRECE